MADDYQAPVGADGQPLGRDESQPYPTWEEIVQASNDRQFEYPAWLPQPPDPEL